VRLAMGGVAHGDLGAALRLTQWSLAHTSRFVVFLCL
jgi:hypothetical protein